jgi:hypothetical protein
MIKPYDIFEIEENGTPLWFASAVSIEEARFHIEKIAVQGGGEFLVLNQKTGDKVVMKSRKPLRRNATEESRPQTSGGAA